MGSSLHELGFGSLVFHKGGKTNAEFARALSEASKDCQDRGGESKARKIMVEFTFQPVTDQDGYTLDVEMNVDIKSKLPAYSSGKCSVGLRRRGNQGTFVFSEEAGDDADPGIRDDDGE